MNKKIKFGIGIILAVVFLLLLSLYWARRKENPEVLLNWLKKGKGDKEEILMRLNMARGDVASPMIKAFKNTKNNDNFRADVLELLFKKNLRTPSPVVESTFVDALKDTSSIVRKRAVDGFRIFADPALKPIMAPFIQDKDPEVRKVAYRTFFEDPAIWEKIKPESRTTLISSALAMKDKETDENLQFLNRSLLGREIAKLSQEGINAYQRSDMTQGDSLFRAASELDPQNTRAAMTQANYYAANDNRSKAIQVAKSKNVLVEIPRLSSAPSIDGDPTDPVWSKGYVQEKVFKGNAWAEETASGKTKLSIGHINGTLYLSLIAFEDDVTKLKITQTKRDSKNYVDDCVEMVFSPKNDKRRYYKFIVNAAGAVYDRFSSNSSANFISKSAVKIFKERGYWSLEFAVSGKDLDNNILKSGDLWNISIVWCRIGVKEERTYFWYDFDDDVTPLALFQ